MCLIKKMVLAITVCTFLNIIIMLIVSTCSEHLKENMGTLLNVKLQSLGVTLLVMSIPTF